MAQKSISPHHEISILIYAYVKWAMLATMAGIFVGLGASFFVWLLEKSTNIVQLASPVTHYLILPLALLASTLLVDFFAPTAKGHGTEKVIEAVHEHNSVINAKVIPVKLLATVVTLAGGGSAGKEGPAAQIGAGLMSVIAQKFSFSSHDRHRLVICGVSAGFAAIFGTPVAGAIFGLEVLIVGQVFYDVIFPSIISGIVSWKVSTLLGVTHPKFIFDFVGSDFSPNMLIWGLLAGAFFGAVALMNIMITTSVEKGFHHLPVQNWIKSLIGAALLISLSFLVGDRYLGLGMSDIDSILQHGILLTPALYLGFVYKSLFTGITLACGGSGGVVTPIFFIGVWSGATFATVLGLPVKMFAALGMVSMLSACANAPISAILMGLELFGAQAAPMVSICCIGAFLMVGHRSIYPSQRLARSKTSLISLEAPDRMDRVLSRSSMSSTLLVKTMAYGRRKTRLRRVKGDQQ